MKYDFTSVIDRTGKDSIAWENIPVPNAEIAEGFDRIPMWVADMNFQTAPSVCEAITKRLEHQDRKSTRLNSSHTGRSRMPSSA